MFLIHCIEKTDYGYHMPRELTCRSIDLHDGRLWHNGKAVTGQIHVMSVETITDPWDLSEWSSQKQATILGLGFTAIAIFVVALNYLRSLLE